MENQKTQTENDVKKPMDIISAAATQLKDIQDQLYEYNATIKELQSDRASLTETISHELEKMGGEAVTEGISIKGVGFLKLNKTPQVRTPYLSKFMEWCKENNQQAPATSINPKVFSSWYKEQLDNNLPIPPEDIINVYWSTSAKINKGA